VVDELLSAINQTQSTLLAASEEVLPVAVEARRRCPTIKASAMALSVCLLSEKMINIFFVFVCMYILVKNGLRIS